LPCQRKLFLAVKQLQVVMMEGSFGVGILNLFLFMTIERSQSVLSIVSDTSHLENSSRDSRLASVIRPVEICRIDGIRKVVPRFWPPFTRCRGGLFYYQELEKHKKYT